MIREEIEAALKYAKLQLALSTNDTKTRCFRTIVLVLRAELTRQENAPLTWNERINQMTVEEKAREFLFANAQDHVFKGTPLEGKFCYIALDGGYYETSEKAIAASEKFLRKPVHGRRHR